MQNNFAQLILFILFLFLPFVQLEKDEDDEFSKRPSLMSRIKAHNFCAEKNSEFWLDIEDELPSNTFFLPCSSLDEHWVECESLSAQKMINGTKVFTFGYMKNNA